MDTVKAKSAT